MKLLDYVEEAKARMGTASDAQLSRALGHQACVVNQYRLRNILPSEATMLRLAELAGVDPITALMDLDSWRAKDENVKQVRARMAAALKATTSAAVFLVALLHWPLSGARVEAGTLAEQVNPAISLLYIIRSFLSRMRQFCAFSAPRPA